MLSLHHELLRNVPIHSRLTSSRFICYHSKKKNVLQISEMNTIEILIKIENGLHLDCGHLFWQNVRKVESDGWEAKMTIMWKTYPYCRIKTIMRHFRWILKFMTSVWFNRRCFYGDWSITSFICTYPYLVPIQDKI